jgi:hypothetical protein
MAKNTSTGGEDQERHDVTVTYTNGEVDRFPDVDGDTARDLENSAFTLPGVAVVEARTKR